jgi:2-methylfumaryl-CoA hydratase
MNGERVRIGGPYFEDFEVGQVFADAPALTLTAGHAAWYQALCGDRLRLPLDHELGLAVTGRREPYAHPNLVSNVAIGQSTGASQRVRGNLFYRGLVLLRAVHLGDTLRTRSRVVGLRQNRARPGKPATGLVALEIEVENQHGERVLDFWRCPMIPLRDPRAETGRGDAFDDIPSDIDLERLRSAVPSEWRLDGFEKLPSARFADLVVGTTYEIEGRDTVTTAPELARLTLNIAATHTDPGVGAYNRRLVYGGHTISIACAQVSRALPNLVTILGWRSCDHAAPVFEGDILRTEVTLEGKHLLRDECGLLDLRARVFSSPAESPAGGPDTMVLDWRFVALAA